MYPESNYVQYQKEIIYPENFQNPNHYYTTTNLTEISNEYQIPVISRNDNNFLPKYKINSENYFKTENEISDNSMNSYEIPINRIKYNRRDIKRINYKYQINPSPNLTQTNSYYYNNKVIVHKRSVNKNYNI